MNYRRFGRTGIEVSELVIGGGYVGGILLHADDATKQTLLERSLAAGINLIDTAASYGDGQSEIAIGDLLRAMPADARPLVPTKFSVDPAAGDLAGQIERSLTQSLQRLGMDRVCAFTLHNFIGEKGFTVAHALDDDGVFDCLDRLREQGYFDFTGFTAAGDPAGCKRIVESGRVDIAQVYYNMLNPSAAYPVADDWGSSNFAGLLAACRAHNVGVMNIRTFAAGVLASPVPHGREVSVTPNTDIAVEQARAAQVFEALGDAYGDRAQTALRFSLANPDISCVVIGLAELAHLETALAAQAMGPLPDAAIEKLKPLWLDNFGE